MDDANEVVSKNKTVADAAGEDMVVARHEWKKPVLVRISAALAEIGGSNAIDEASQS